MGLTNWGNRLSTSFLSADNPAAVLCSQTLNKVVASWATLIMCHCCDHELYIYNTKGASSWLSMTPCFGSLEWNYITVTVFEGNFSWATASLLLLYFTVSLGEADFIFISQQKCKLTLRKYLNFIPADINCILNVYWLHWILIQCFCVYIILLNMFEVMPIWIVQILDKLTTQWW